MPMPTQVGLWLCTGLFCPPLPSYACDYGNHSANEPCQPPMPESCMMLCHHKSFNQPKRTTDCIQPRPTRVGRDTDAARHSASQPTRHPADDASQSVCDSVSVSEIIIIIFICPIIQQYTHLHEYGLEEQHSKIR